CIAFCFQAGVRIRVFHVTGVQTCALPVWNGDAEPAAARHGLVELGGEFVRLVLLQPVPVVESAAQFGHRCADQLLILGQLEVHPPPPLVSVPRLRRRGPWPSPQSDAGSALAALMLNRSPPRRSSPAPEWVHSSSTVSSRST